MLGTYAMSPYDYSDNRYGIIMLAWFTMVSALPYVFVLTVNRV